MRISKKRVLSELLLNNKLPKKRFHKLEEVVLEKNMYLGSHYWDFAAYICKSFDKVNPMISVDLFAPRYIGMEISYVFVEKKGDVYIIDVSKNPESKHWIQPVIRVKGQHIDGRMVWEKEVARVKNIKFYFGLNEVFCSAEINDTFAQLKEKLSTIITVEKVERNVQSVGKVIGLSNPKCEILLSFAENEKHPAGLLFIVEEPGQIDSHLILFLEGYGFMGGLTMDHSPKGKCKLVHNKESETIIADSQNKPILSLERLSNLALHERAICILYNSEYAEYNNYVSFVTMIPKEVFEEETAEKQIIRQQRKITFQDDDFDELANCIRHNKSHTNTIGSLILEWDDWNNR